MIKNTALERREDRNRAQSGIPTNQALPRLGEAGGGESGPLLEPLAEPTLSWLPEALGNGSLLAACHGVCNALPQWPNEIEKGSGFFSRVGL